MAHLSIIRALSHVSKVAAAVIRGLQETNQLGMLPKASGSANGAATTKAAKSNKKATVPP